MKNTLTNDPGQRRRRDGVLEGRRRRQAPPAGPTATASSRRPASSPRWSTSTSCSRSSHARCSRPSDRSTSTTRTSTRPSRPSSPTPSIASGTRCSTTTSRARRRRERRQDDNSLPLLDGVPQPAGVLQQRHRPSRYTPEQAAGAIVMGSSDQVGNELDEFVTETLRNNLLGLPLDLPTINMTRAREAGVPPLNDLRRQIHAQTNDGQLAPYTDWSDFGQHLKHPESLVNFVAAYGTHPTIRSSSGSRRPVQRLTVAAKRAAARAIVDPLPTDTQPGRCRRLHVQHRHVGQPDGETRPRQRRPVGRRSRRGHEPLRRPARQHVQLRVPEHAGEPPGRRPALLPEPDAGHEPAYAARGQLVRRDDRAQHGWHAHAEGRRLRNGRLQVRARPPRSRPRPARRSSGGLGGRRPDHHGLRREPAAPAEAGRHDPVPQPQHGRPVRYQRAGRLQRHRRCRPGLRRQRQRHLLGQRRQRHPRGQRRRRRHPRR